LGVAATAPSGTKPARMKSKILYSRGKIPFGRAIRYKSSPHAHAGLLRAFHFYR
jgi:hypothetical protein